MENDKVLDEMIEQYEEYVNEPIEMDCEDVVGAKYDKKQFKKGIEDTSYLCGQITALMNTGLSEECVLAIVTGLMNQQSLDKQFAVEKEITAMQNQIVEMKEL